MNHEDQATKYLVYYEFQKEENPYKLLSGYEENGMHEARSLLADRLLFRTCRAGVEREIHKRINKLRTGLGRSELALTDALNAVAKEAWNKRVDIPDGFVAIPGCKFESTAAGTAGTYGCLVYYTPRWSNDAHCNSLPEAALAFWTNDGQPTNPPVETSSDKSQEKQRYFPSTALGESFTYPGNAVFEKNRAKFTRQVLNPRCTGVGLHLDMVQADEEKPRNLICLVAIFDAPLIDDDEDDDE